jgi:FlaA1/EpsC-like NDP-sugar epimerase
MKKIAIWFLRLPRKVKAGILISIDLILIEFSLWLSFSLRLGELYAPTEDIWTLFALTPIIAVPIFIRLGLYRAIIRYLGGRALWAIFQAVSFYALLFTFIVFLTGIGLVPRTVPILHWLILLFLIAGSRFLARWGVADVYYRLGGKVAKDCLAKKVIIYGAGSAGAQLAAALEHGQEFKPVAFIDDDPALKKQKINGLRIYDLAALSYLVERHDVHDVLLAMPSVPRVRRNEIIRLLEPFPVHVRSMPGLADIAQGKIRFDELQEIDIADLLGRDTVKPIAELLHADISGKVVLITGAGGSIGAELCRQILTLKPTQLVLLDHSEYALYTIMQELRGLSVRSGIMVEIVPILGSVNEEVRLFSLIKSFAVQTIYHAAAYKHVPIVEHNPLAAARNNVLGTYAVARAAMNCGVESFVLISTDKAVRPTNIMGASKRFAELVLQALSLEAECHTRFCIVRFGNVLGSSGSVIPLFREQISQGGPVTVTDERIIRYFMTIQEAVQLVIQAGAMGGGGDVFVLDMGEPVRIVDLARRMIHLSGLEVKDENHPEGEIEIVYTGLRPGEKLYEELLIGQNVSETEHPRIMRAQEDVLPWTDLQIALEKMQTCIVTGNVESLRELLKDSVFGYKPQCEIKDFLWQAQKKTLQPTVGSEG